MKIDKKRIEEILSEEIQIFKNKKRSENILESLNEKWDKDVEVKSTGEYADKTIAELEKEVDKLKKESDKYQEDGKKVPQKNKKKMSELNFAIRAKKGWPKGKKK